FLSLPEWWRTFPHLGRGCVVSRLLRERVWRPGGLAGDRSHFDRGTPLDHERNALQPVAHHRGRLGPRPTRPGCQRGRHARVLPLSLQRREGPTGSSLRPRDRYIAVILPTSLAAPSGS